MMSCGGHYGKKLCSFFRFCSAGQQNDALYSVLLAVAKTQDKVRGVCVCVCDTRGKGAMDGVC